MTALAQYERLEALGIWRAHDGAEGREVVIKFGQSTMVLEATADVPLAHWSLPALRRRSSGDEEAVYAPDFESSETLTVTDPEMRTALDRVLSARLGAPAAPHSRVPLMVVTALLLAVVGIAMLNLPTVLGGFAPTFIAPERARVLAGQMLPLVEERTGPTCTTSNGDGALERLARRLMPQVPARVHVADLGDLPYLALPGDTVVISRHIAERAESPEEFAGWAALAFEDGAGQAALGHVFRASGIADGLSFLANGSFSDRTLDAAVNRLMLSADVRRPLDLSAATYRLADAGIPAEPLVAGIRREGTSSGPLSIPPVEGSEGGPEVMTDGEWVALRGICDG